MNGGSGRGGGGGVQHSSGGIIISVRKCTGAVFLLSAPNTCYTDEDSLRSGVYQVVFVELTTTGTVDLQELERDLNDKLHLCLTVIHSGHERHLRKAPYPDVKVFLVKPAAFIRLRNYMLTDAGASPSELKESKGLLQNSLDLIRFMASERI
ncbi:hypothetical protein BV898_13345 [Hypsibius exemplaris]|uniref:Uncharacterized protein n=1 Tax=Hypsibius exemplaris TaxID=2072580 RepID=A0A1W0WB44_HYPEX|nr:hypothetical protein BV898_13345 [Hypsibius exemplaris]